MIKQIKFEFVYCKQIESVVSLFISKETTLYTCNYVIIFFNVYIVLLPEKISLLQNRRPESKIRTHESNNI